MRTFRVGHLVDYLRASVGDDAAKAMIYDWIREGVQAIRDLEWPWNWTETSYLTVPPLTEDDCTWTEGNDWIDTLANVSISKSSTGRFVELGDQWYRVVDVGVVNTKRIYVDRRIEGSNAEAKTLYFYRPEYAIYGNKIQNVECGDYDKLARFSPSRDYFATRRGASFKRLEPGTPYAYLDVQSFKLDPPKYPLAYSSSGAGTFPNGTYKMFATVFCPESNLESPPGPETIFVVEDGKSPSITYTAPSGLLERTTYSMRYYLSERSPGRDRPPMYRVYERDCNVATAYVSADVDPSGNIYNKEGYRDDNQVVVRLVPPPDASRKSVTITHTNTYGFFPNDRDMIEMGFDNVVIEALRMHLKALAGAAGRDSKEYHGTMISFRRHMMYMLAKTNEEAGESDFGPSTHQPLETYTEESGDWVDFLQNPDSF